MITGVEPFGIFAQGIEIPAEGLIPIANLPDDHYNYDRTARLLSGYEESNQFRLGDKISVKVARVDTDRREMEYQMVDGKGNRGTGKSKSKPKRDGGGRSDEKRGSRKPRKHK